jgi:acyl dehydratase
MTGALSRGRETLSFAPLFIRSVIRVEGLKNTLSYRADRVRYVTPVPAGSRLRRRVSIVAAEHAASGGLRVTYGLTIEIEGSERPACEAEVIGVHYF